MEVSHSSLKSFAILILIFFFTIFLPKWWFIHGLVVFKMYFPFRYEMGSPGVFEEIVNSSDEGGYFEEKYLADNNIVTRLCCWILIGLQDKLNLIHQYICEWYLDLKCLLRPEMNMNWIEQYVCCCRIFRGFKISLYISAV